MLIALSSNLNMKASTKHNCKSLLTHLYPPVTHKDPSLGKSVTRTSELISPSFKENGSKRLIASKFSIKCPVFKQKNTVSRLSIVASTVQPLSLIHICRCRRYAVCRSRWSPYH
eukprot:TRINITY_DN14176_c0_g2_i1.p1 TRINITY_DN14176_c0_g2~~TRINITY_DN14176_c0_g2_i1.p1  ORF type:complete len:114 (+),score=9.19 TRINITY_DN14176_c0_g2_i1:64-405(+)